MVVVGDRTGVGKTRVLRALAAKNHQVLDLEALAAHRGSAFGDLKGAAQPSNAAFETKCAWAWRALDATRDVFVEDEEGHVGRCLVPPALYARMRAAPRVVRVDASDAARVAHLLEDYAEDEAAGAGGARARLDAALALVAKRLGPDDTARAKRLLDADDLAACARLLLARYYDKLYDRHLGRRGDAVLAVRAADPFETGAVAAEVAAAVSCADAADLPPPPLVEVTRPPPSARDDDCVQWYAPSEPRWRRRRAIALRRLAASPRFCELFNVLLCHLPSAVRARCNEYQASPKSRNPLVPVPPRPPSPPTPRGGRGPGRGGAKSLRESKKSQSAERSGAAASRGWRVRQEEIEQARTEGRARPESVDHFPNRVASRQTRHAPRSSTPKPRLPRSAY